MKSVLILLFIFVQSSTAFSQHWELDFNHAVEKAQESNKTIILVFSGSDWCAPCIKLEKEIWETATFQKYAKDHYIMVRADFPRRKANRLSEEQEAKNAKLAEKYNSNGYFPLVVIINKDKEVLGKTGYKELRPQEYIDHLNSFIK